MKSLSVSVPKHIASDARRAVTSPVCRCRGHRPGLGLLMVLLALVLAPAAVQAFPPAPYHLIYGIVKDEFGFALNTPNTQVVLQTATGVVIQADLVPGLGPGVDYQLKIPMDSGLTSETYNPIAQTPAASFKIFVVMGQITNTPIQMLGDYTRLGEPGESSRIDLTLGEDDNHDGISDDWELALLAELGSNLTLDQINANSILTPDGRTLAQEFQVGGNPLGPTGPLTVSLVDYHSGSPVLEFATTHGHGYTVLGSSDLRQWTPLQFRNTADGPSGQAYTTYTASSAQTLQVQVLLPSPGPSAQFFKIQQQ